MYRSTCQLTLAPWRASLGVAMRRGAPYVNGVDKLVSGLWRASREWGTTAAERALRFPCDAFALEADEVLFRGVTVNAPATTVFRWLCQLRVAPYSYDWIDNWGRRSPPRLIEGLEQLARGQEFMSIFELVDYETDRHVTLRIKRASAAERVFGDIRGTYLVSPVGQRSRLLVKLRAKYPPSLRGMATSRVLPWGDLVMMRRQLLNLKRLAEGSRRPAHA
jgi:hypothetical protein